MLGVKPHTEVHVVLKVFFGAVAGLTLCASLAAPAATPAPRARPHARASHAPTVEELYSLRARRRMAAFLRLRLLEWREEGLSRAAEVIERRLPVDALVPTPSP
jgi:hypothetical protein